MERNTNLLVSYSSPESSPGESPIRRGRDNRNDGGSRRNGGRYRGRSPDQNRRRNNRSRSPQRNTTSSRREDSFNSSRSPRNRMSRTPRNDRHRSRSPRRSPLIDPRSVISCRSRNGRNRSRSPRNSNFLRHHLSRSRSPEKVTNDEGRNRLSRDKDVLPTRDTRRIVVGDSPMKAMQSYESGHQRSPADEGEKKRQRRDSRSLSVNSRDVKDDIKNYPKGLKLTNLTQDALEASNARIKFLEEMSKQAPDEGTSEQQSKNDEEKSSDTLMNISRTVYNDRKLLRSENAEEDYSSSQQSSYMVKYKVQKNSSDGTAGVDKIEYLNNERHRRKIGDEYADHPQKPFVVQYDIPKNSPDDPGPKGKYEQKYGDDDEYGRSRSQYKEERRSPKLGDHRNVSPSYRDDIDKDSKRGRYEEFQDKPDFDDDRYHVNEDIYNNSTSKYDRDRQQNTRSLSDFYASGSRPNYENISRDSRLEDDRERYQNSRSKFNDDRSWDPRSNLDDRYTDSRPKVDGNYTRDFDDDERYGKSKSKYEGERYRDSDIDRHGNSRSNNIDERSNFSPERNLDIRERKRSRSKFRDADLKPRFSDERSRSPGRKYPSRTPDRNMDYSPINSDDNFGGSQDAVDNSKDVRIKKERKVVNNPLKDLFKIKLDTFDKTNEITPKTKPDPNADSDLYGFALGMENIETNEGGNNNGIDNLKTDITNTLISVPVTKEEELKYKEDNMQQQQYRNQLLIVCKTADIDLKKTRRHVNIYLEKVDIQIEEVDITYIGTRRPKMMGLDHRQGALIMFQNLELRDKIYELKGQLKDLLIVEPLCDARRDMFNTACQYYKKKLLKRFKTLNGGVYIELRGHPGWIEVKTETGLKKLMHKVYADHYADKEKKKEKKTSKDSAVGKGVSKDEKKEDKNEVAPAAAVAPAGATGVPFGNMNVPPPNNSPAGWVNPMWGNPYGYAPPPAWGNPHPPAWGIPPPVHIPPPGFSPGYAPRIPPPVGYWGNPALSSPGVPPAMNQMPLGVPPVAVGIPPPTWGNPPVSAVSSIPTSIPLPQYSSMPQSQVAASTAWTSPTSASSVAETTRGTANTTWTGSTPASSVAETTRGTAYTAWTGSTPASSVAETTRGTAYTAWTGSTSASSVAETNNITVSTISLLGQATDNTRPITASTIPSMQSDAATTKHNAMTIKESQKETGIVESNKPKTLVSPQVNKVLVDISSLPTELAITFNMEYDTIKGKTENMLNRSHLLLKMVNAGNYTSDNNCVNIFIDFPLPDDDNIHESVKSWTQKHKNLAFFQLCKVLSSFAAADDDGNETGRLSMPRGMPFSVLMKVLYYLKALHNIDEYVEEYVGNLKSIRDASEVFWLIYKLKVPSKLLEGMMLLLFMEYLKCDTNLLLKCIQGVDVSFETLHKYVDNSCKWRNIKHETLFKNFSFKCCHCQIREYVRALVKYDSIVVLSSSGKCAHKDCEDKITALMKS